MASSVIDFRVASIRNSTGDVKRVEQRDGRKEKGERRKAKGENRNLSG